MPESRKNDRRAIAGLLGVQFAAGFQYIEEQRLGFGKNDGTISAGFLNLFLKFDGNQHNLLLLA